MEIEIVTGFLGSGKTYFINSLLKESQVKGEKVIVLQLENGKSEIYEQNDVNYPMKLIKLNELKDLDEKMLFIINKYNPNRIIVEYNGTSNLEDLINILKERKYKEFIRISTVFFVADGKCLREYIENLGNFIVPFIQCANMIVINNLDYCNKEVINEQLKTVKNINPKAYILKVNNKYILNYKLRQSKVLDNGYLKKLKVKMMNSKNL